ncbi:hypothetical protein F4774DRAFT_229978 [Daldinia eschscholtzii]|nr:hypothetical protein F4774DRAFT_229978 [Daldinia eschscholtzii]
MSLFLLTCQSKLTLSSDVFFFFLFSREFAMCRRAWLLVISFIRMLTQLAHPVPVCGRHFNLVGANEVRGFSIVCVLAHVGTYISPFFVLYPRTVRMNYKEVYSAERRYLVCRSRALFSLPTNHIGLHHSGMLDRRLYILLG